MKCKKCGKEYEGNFCPYCGTAANDNACPKCGKKREPGVRYCSSCGYDFQASPVDAKIKHTGSNIGAKIKSVPKKTWIIVSAVAIAIVVVIVTVVLLISFFSNKFRIGVVEKIDIGDSKQQVIDLLGEPYDYNVNSSVFEYYSDNYLSLLQEYDSLNPDDIEDFDDLEDAFGDAFELEQKLQTEEYKYIEIHFDSNGLVREIFFDPARTEENKNEAKMCNSYELITKNVLRYAQTDLIYEARFDDGSYYKGTAVSDFFVAEADIEKANAEWTDQWENQYNATVEVKDNPNIIVAGELGEGVIYSLSGQYVLTISGEGSFNTDARISIPSDRDDITTISVYLTADVLNFRADALSFYKGSTLLNMNIDSVSVAKDNPMYTVLDSCIVDKETGTRLVMGTSAGIIPAAIKTIESHAFRGETMTTIHWYATACESVEEDIFYHCDGVRSIIIENGVHSIPYRAFGESSSPGNLTNVTELIISEGVTSIEGGAFFGLSITEITIPTSLMSVGNRFLGGCDELTTIVWNAAECVLNTTSGEPEVFGDCISLSNIVIGSAVISLPNYLFRQNINLDVHVENISSCFNIPSFGRWFSSSGWDLYVGDELVTDLTIPATIAKVSDYAFYHCTSLQNLSFAGENTQIGGAAFTYCENLVNVSLPTKLEEIVGFSYCTSLSSITLPNSLKTIGHSAFAYSGLAQVVIPASVTCVATDAFSRCANLTSITFEDTEGWVKASRAGETEGMWVASADDEMSNPATLTQKFKENDWWTWSYLNKKVN